MMNHPANELDRTAVVSRRFVIAGVTVDVFEDEGDPRVLTSWPDGVELLARPNPDDDGVVTLALRLGYGAGLADDVAGVGFAWGGAVPRSVARSVSPSDRARLAWWLTRDHELAHTMRASVGEVEGQRWSPSLRCAALAVLEARPPGQRCPHDDGHALEEAAVLDLQAHIVGVWGPEGPRPWDRSEVEAPTGP